MCTQTEYLLEPSPANATLVIMAAGLGSRYGGDKQVDGIGPNGEFLMEYAIYDALKAGFHKVVFIIKPDMDGLIHRMCGDYLEKIVLADGKPLEVHYAYQDFSSLPVFVNLLGERTKPFGTVHAVLCAEPFIKEPFCVINADDYYGPEAYSTIIGELAKLPADGHATMVAYRLKNTASLNGAVSRGICEIEDDNLCAVRETKRIQMYENGELRNLENDSLLDPYAPVSMNFWGFTPGILPAMREYFEQFLHNVSADNLNAECLLPVMVDDLLKKGKIKVSVLHSSAKWFGMTYQEDKPLVAKELRALHADNYYPESLRSSAKEVK